MTGEITDVFRKQLVVKEELDLSQSNGLAGLLLAEFAPGPGVRVMAEAGGALLEEAGSPRLQASGKRIHRVVNQKHETVAQYDPVKMLLPIDFIRGRGRVVLASARPGDPYVWQLTGILEPENCDAPNPIMPVYGSRLATHVESRYLDRKFPGWLAACRELDAGLAADAAAEAAAQAKRAGVRVRPPAARLAPGDLEDQDDPAVG